uniref:Uncharacterized protein n=1 Tax=Tetraselmis sp. GSL018 TaxID=582737 RepID=A0A061S744_9CHLO
MGSLCCPGISTHGPTASLPAELPPSLFLNLQQQPPLPIATAVLPHAPGFFPASPYDRTLYMDPDTGVCGPKRRIDELFAALDEYDLAVSAEKPKAASSSPAMNVYSSSIPRKFLERYWRVVLYRRTEPMLELLDKIMEIFTAASNLGLGHTSDQQAVREALYLSKGRTMEKRLNDSRELCRLPLKKHKGGCGKLEPLCKASKCVLLQDRCERRPDATKGRPAAKGRPGTKAAPAKAPAQGR